MSSNNVKLEVVQDMRDGKITPDQAVAAFEKLTPTEQRGGRVYKSSTPEQRMKCYSDARALRDQMQRNKIPFITPQFFPGFYLCQGLVLIGAESGRGKSTLAGNVVAGIIHNCVNARVMMISNEESADAIYERIAAISLGIPFTKIHTKSIDSLSQKKVESYIRDVLTHSVEVVTDDNFKTSMEEDVMSVMESGAHEGYNAIILDYHQNVTSSRNNPEKESYRVSKDLGQYYKDFGKRCSLPVITFAQLSARADASKFKDRVENDKTLYNHSFMAIEIIADTDTCTSTFKIHKDRFCNSTGKEIVMNFEGGKFVMPRESR